MSLRAAQKAELAARIDELIVELTSALQDSENSGETVELDQTRQGRLSRMDALQAQAMAKAASQRQRRQLIALQAAKGRLNDEDFGLCEDCDELIAWARLQFNPSVNCCLQCAEIREST